MPSSPVQWFMFFGCVVVVYILFRGSCALLYDACGWVLQIVGPEEPKPANTLTQGLRAAFFWSCILLLSFLAWNLI